MASFLAGISGASSSLRKTTVTHDTSPPLLTTYFAETPAEISSYQECALDINLEQWVHLIPDYTFRTMFLPISLENAQTFVYAFEAFSPEDSISGTNAENLISLQFDLDEISQQLQKVVDDINSEYVFVKTSCRSPKDATISCSQMETLYLQQLSTYPPEERAVENNKLISILRASKLAMRLKFSDEAMRLFTHR